MFQYQEYGAPVSRTKTPPNITLFVDTAGVGKAKSMARRKKRVKKPKTVLDLIQESSKNFEEHCKRFESDAAGVTVPDNPCEIDRDVREIQAEIDAF